MSENTPGQDFSTLPTFSVTSHRADGGCSMTGLVTLSLAASVAAVLTGLLAGFVAQWFYLVVLFPIGMGFGIGMVGCLAVKQGKVRMPLVCGGAGFLAGCLAVAAMHYYEYQSFETQMKEVPEGVRQVAKNFDKLQAKRDQLPAEIQELLDEIGKDPDSRQALAIDGFLSHLDFMAHQGVTISKHGRGGFNLGYTGSYIYWGVELLIIAGFAFVLMRGAADEPFCTQCENWKQQESLGSFGASVEKARTALESGDLPELGASMGSSGDLVATMFQCPQCGASAPVEMRFEKVTVNAKGETSKNTLCTVTYPGEAVPALAQLFTPNIVTGEIAPPDANPSA